MLQTVITYEDQDTHCMIEEVDWISLNSADHSEKGPQPVLLPLTPYAMEILTKQLNEN